MKSLKIWYKTKALIVTSLGVRFISFMVIIGIAATNTGNNLLYLILAMMLSLMLISGILSEACLYHLHFERFIPDVIYAGQPVSISLLIRNRKKTIPSFSLHVRDTLGRPTEEVSREIYFFKLAPSTFQERSYTLFFNKRGVFPFRGVTYSTRFPFGIFLKMKQEKELNQTEVVVFPRTFPVLPLEKETDRTGHSPTLRRGHGVSLFQFRPYLPGDDARSIHWKISAKRNRLIVREFEAEEEKKIGIGLSSYLQGTPTKEALERFEKGIELGASFCRHYLERGYLVSFFTDKIIIPFGKGLPHLKEILTLLAYLEINHNKDRLLENSRLSAPLILISPFLPVRIGGPSCLKIFQPDDIDRLSYWDNI